MKIATIIKGFLLNEFSPLLGIAIKESLLWWLPMTLPLCQQFRVINWRHSSIVSRCGCVHLFWMLYTYYLRIVSWCNGNTVHRVGSPNYCGISVTKVHIEISIWQYVWVLHHYSDVITSAMASQTTGVSIVYSTVCSGIDQRKHQSYVSLAFVRGMQHWPMISLHKGTVAWKMLSFHDVIMPCDDLLFWG